MTTADDKRVDTSKPPIDKGYVAILARRPLRTAFTVRAASRSWAGTRLPSRASDDTPDFLAIRFAAFFFPRAEGLVFLCGLCSSQR